jgi:hypothetical protein
MNGKPVMKKNTISVQKGMNSVSLDVAELASGTYMLAFNDGSHRTVKKFIRQ